MVHHITVQTSLFLVTGLIERRGGTANMDRLGGLARLSPLLAVLYFIPAINLAGIPPFSGFLGKLGLMQAGVDLGTPLAYILVAASVLTSLLTLLVMARVWNRAFWRTPEDAVHPDPILLATTTDGSTVRDSGNVSGQSSGRFGGRSTVNLLPKSMVYPTVGLVALGVSLTILAGPLFSLSDDAAQDLLDRTPYIEAVLGEGSAP